MAMCTSSDASLTSTKIKKEAETPGGKMWIYSTSVESENNFLLLVGKLIKLCITEFLKKKYDIEERQFQPF